MSHLLGGWAITVTTIRGLFKIEEMEEVKGILGLASTKESFATSNNNYKVDQLP